MRTLDTLYTSVGTLRGREAMKQFLRDLLTPSERIMLGRRIMIARMLVGGASWEAISVEMKVGSDTIWRIDKLLRDQVSGYEDALKLLGKEMEKREEKLEWKRVYEDYSWRGTLALLKKKYPLHFLLFPWPEGYGPKARRRRASEQKA